VQVATRQVFKPRTITPNFAEIRRISSIKILQGKARFSCCDQFTATKSTNIQSDSPFGQLQWRPTAALIYATMDEQ